VALLASRALPSEPTTPGPSAADSITRAEIDALLVRSLADASSPGGYVLAITSAERTLYLQAYGWASRNHPMTTDRMFPIASVTKTFTGVLLAKLADTQRVELDMPLRRYLPAEVQLHPELESSSITLRILMTHRSGLPKDQVNRRNLQLDLPGGFDPTIPHPDSYGRAAFREGLVATPPVIPPLSGHHYSNLGVHLAGYAIELQLGRPFARLLDDEILQPLGLKETVFSRTAAMNRRVPQGYAFNTASGQYHRVPAWTAGEIAAGSGLSSTAADLAIYVRCLMNSLCTTGLVGPKGERELFEPSIEYLRAPETLYAQALGWRLSHFGPYGVFYRHNGDADGHHAFVAFSRDRGIGVVLLTNGQHDAMEEAGNRVLLLLLQQSKRPRL
jgi:CubicO group peptidase (beta-lactamase class C family)